MKRAPFCVVALALTAAIALDASAISPKQSWKPAPKIGAWTIAITTQGGFSGRGNGGVTVASDGSVAISFLGDVKPRCTFQLHTAALDDVVRLVVQATPQHWVESYTPASINARCCDLITTTLRLTRDEDDRQVVYETRWTTGEKQLPKDLFELIAAVALGDNSIRTRFTPLCTKTP